MTQKLKSPIQWFGGKQSMVSKLLPLFPEHHTYVEPFGGAGSLLLAKQPSPVEVYNDLDSDLVNFFRVVRDRDGLFPQLYNVACLSPYSREEYNFCREHLNDDPCPVERARRFFVLARYGFGGLIGNSFGICVTASSRGKVAQASSFQSALCMLPLIADRLMDILIEQRDFRDVLSTYMTEQTFAYLDPPYVPSTRKSGKYRCEMTLADHADLVEILRNFKGKAMLSGYPNELYDSLGWNRKEWEVCCSAVGRTRNSGLQGTGALRQEHKRVVCVWMDY